MALVRITPARVYVNGKLVAEANSVKFSVSSNDEQGFGLDGGRYFSTGSPSSTVEFDTMVAATGQNVDFKGILAGHKDVTITLLLDGGAESVDGRFQERSYDSDSKSGMLKGSFKFVGGDSVSVG